MSFSKMPILLHLWKRSWTTLEETPNQSRWMAFHWHPVQRARTYLGVDDGPIRGPRPAAFGTLLLVFGQAFLEFPPQRARKMEVVHTPGCGSLSLIRRISFEEGDIGSLILGEMRPSS